MQPLLILYLIAGLFTRSGPAEPPVNNRLTALTSPILFRGDEHTAYRDPAFLYHQDSLYVFFTLVRIEEEHKIYAYVAMSRTKDLQHWTPIRTLTPRDQRLNYSSPGNVVRQGDEWVLCLQTYPRPDYTTDQMPRYATQDARIFTMRSRDLHHWSSPELLRVKGSSVTEKDMGRMIDPYLLADKDAPGKWWCFYKQNGVSMSSSYDLRNWTFVGHTESGENACVLVEDSQYILMHSPKNGIGLKRSTDLKSWQDWGGLITLGQSDWPWAKGRLTAGAVLNLKQVPAFGKYVMLFHGSGPLSEEAGDFDKNASIGIAWSDDLLNWQWPAKTR
ncbi:glycoside hydrolase family protein [Spirosoma aerolatum]|uniref:hypothetical protein n=1 Tax=Spirosoma aerolatum TaxID=1211326 RepID=UPI0009ACA8D3|nr:hypothetical protein [Spirosoma aerolatum]